MKTSITTIVLLAAALLVLPQVASASVITTSDIMAIPAQVTGSGNGTLDLRMFTFSGSEIRNRDVQSGFNGDNGNNTLPNGGGTDTNTFVESYVTTAGDLKAFFNLNFDTGSVTDLMIFLDLNETGAGEPVNSLDLLNIVLNPTTIQGNPDPTGDVTSDEQAAINQVYTGGTLIAWLNPQPANNLPVNNQGAGFADYAIFTGINVFSLNDSDVLLFNISMSHLNNGAEELFLSGTYSPDDVKPPEPPQSVIPEPASLSLLSVAGIGFLLRRRRAAR